MKRQNKIFWWPVAVLALILFSSSSLYAAKIDPHLQRIIDSKGSGVVSHTFAKTFSKKGRDGSETFVHVFIEASPSAIAQLRAKGAVVNTVTSSGIMTAIVPLSKINSLAAIDDVRHISIGQPVKKMMDISSGPTGVNLPQTVFPRSEHSGEGVIVGVIDTGIDIEHPDFFNISGNTRVLSIWDHTLDADDVGNSATAPTGFSYGTEWSRSQIQGGYATCPHRDIDGHGTHVAGTAAGNGSAPSYGGPYTGLAPNAELLIVKFDFDNIKNRNSDTMVIDAINWIFQKAAAEGKPCVINMSLGSDYGPHDGTTAEERGLDDLTGPGKIVNVSAGNAGSSWEGPSFDTHGGPIHGSGTMDTDFDIVFSTPADYAPSSDADYVFFDIWYPGNINCYVRITSPSGITYPQGTKGPNRRLWYTNGRSGGFSTPEGFIYVENVSGTDSFWNASNDDNNIYVEISDSQGVEPAAGTWVVELIPDGVAGEYQSWQGFSDSLTHSFFWYDSGSVAHTIGNTSDPALADNNMTIGKPASAHSAIAIGAYQTKASWPGRQYDDCYDPNSGFSYIDMAYGLPPITYYNDFYLDDIAYFSSRGPSRDGRTEPFISAPGVGIVASLSQTNLNIPGDNYYRCMHRVEYGGYYATLQGTSMSSPHATGSIAVLLEEAKKAGLNPTPAEMKDILRLGARKDTYTGLNPADPDDSNNDWGYGKIDVSESLNYIGTSEPPPVLIACTPDSGVKNSSLTVVLSGTDFQEGATVKFGENIGVLSTTVDSAEQITCDINIGRRAKTGSRTIIVTNPDGQSGILTNGFTVNRK